MTREAEKMDAVLKRQGELSTESGVLQNLASTVLLSQFPLSWADDERMRLWQGEEGLPASALVPSLRAMWQGDKATFRATSAGLERAGNMGKLLRATFYLWSGQLPEVREEALQVLADPGAELCQQILAHLCLGSGAALEGQRGLAASACARAFQLASRRQARVYRLPALLLWATALQDVGSDEVTPKLLSATRLARTPLETTLVTLTRAVLLARHGRYESLEALRQARKAVAGTTWAAHLVQLEREALHVLGREESLRVPKDVPEACLSLRAGGSLQLGELRLNLEGAPLLTLLVAYLVAHPAAPLTDVAEAILPPDTGRGNYADELHRVARVRQLAQRLRALTGDPRLIVCRRGKLQLTARYEWRSDVCAYVGMRELGLYRCRWLEDLLDEQMFTTPP